MRKKIVLGSLAASLSVAAAMVLADLAPASAQPTAGGVPSVPEWNGAGQNSANTRFAANESKISQLNVKNLKQRWVAQLKGNVAATPTVVGGTVYVPDYGGVLSAVDASTGQVRWQRPIQEYSGVADDISRTSPVVFGNSVIFGDGVSAKSAGISDGGFSGPSSNGARVMAADRSTGAPLWKTVIDDNPAAIETSSPTLVGNTIYVGVSSRTEFLPDDNNAPPPSFVGSVVALDATTGAIKWKTKTAPDGYTGNAVWGSSLPVDTAAGLVFAATGNNYSTPAGICNKPGQKNCTIPPANDLTDAVVAFDLNTGAVKWSFKSLTADAGLLDCLTCGPDFDFGSAPNLFKTRIGGKDTAVVGVGQKSGIYWALDEATGQPIWHTQVGPGGEMGGIQWGSATDGTRIYAAIGNIAHKRYQIKSSLGIATNTNGGSWAALDPATGKILWQTADPAKAPDIGFVSAANGVVYAGSTRGDGDSMLALNAANGRILWRYHSGGSVLSGAAIVDGTVYWGSGYWFAACKNALSTACGTNDKLYAFATGAAPAPTASAG